MLHQTSLDQMTSSQKKLSQVHSVNKISIQEKPSEENIDISFARSKQGALPQPEDEENELDRQKADVLQDHNEEGEFNPYYYFQLIDASLLEEKTSNPYWKLQLDIKQHFQDYDQKFRVLKQKVDELESLNKRYEVPNKRFDIMQFEIDPKKFDPNNQFKPVLNQKNLQWQTSVQPGDSKAKIYSKILLDIEKE